MKKKTLPYFGEIDAQHLNDYYPSKMLISEQEIKIDMNFNEISITMDKLEKVKTTLIDIENIIQKVNALIDEDFKNEGKQSQLSEYLLDHAEIFGEDFQEAKALQSSDLTNVKNLTDSIYLKRIGFYPEDEAYFIVFDYTLKNYVTDQILVVVLQSNFKLKHITIES